MKNETKNKNEAKQKNTTIYSTRVGVNEQTGKFPRGLHRKNFVEGADGDKLYVQYLRDNLDIRVKVRTKQMEQWQAREQARIENVQSRLSGTKDPKRALENQIARLQAKLIQLQNKPAN